MATDRIIATNAFDFDSPNSRTVDVDRLVQASGAPNSRQTQTGEVGRAQLTASPQELSTLPTPAMMPPPPPPPPPQGYINTQKQFLNKKKIDRK